MNESGPNKGIPIVKKIDEFQGCVDTPNNEELLFDEYRYETWRGTFSHETYVRDMNNDGIFTLRELSLSSLAEVIENEKHALHTTFREKKQRRDAERHAEKASLGSPRDSLYRFIRSRQRLR